MPTIETASHRVKLSICIATFNRANFIGATLESVISQATDSCEIVVADNASTDHTQQVVLHYAARFARLRYVKQETNQGFDRNFDSAVELSHGEHCWLVPDDDLMKPGAVSAVLNALARDLSLIIVNYERRNFRMSRVVLPRYLETNSNRVYGPEEMDRLFSDTGNLLIYVGSVIIKRSIWIARERERYFGSMFIHIGVIFQERMPGDTLLLAEPLMSYRDGNSKSYFARFFEILMIRWPALVWSLAPSESAKKLVCSTEPWRNSLTLLLYRAGGCYSPSDYHRWIRPRLSSRMEMVIPFLIAHLPGVLLNTILVIFYRITRHPRRKMRLQFLNESPFRLKLLQGLRPGLLRHD